MEEVYCAARSDMEYMILRVFGICVHERPSINLLWRLFDGRGDEDDEDRKSWADDEQKDR